MRIYNKDNTIGNTYCTDGVWRWRLKQDADIIGTGDLGFKYQADAFDDLVYLLDNRWIFPALMHYQDVGDKWRWRIKVKDDILYSSHQGWWDKEQCLYNAKYLATSEWDCE